MCEECQDRYLSKINRNLTTCSSFGHILRKCRITDFGSTLVVITIAARNLSIALCASMTFHTLNF